MSTIEITYIELYGLIACSLGLVVLTTVMYIHLLQLLNKSKDKGNKKMVIKSLFLKSLFFKIFMPVVDKYTLSNLSIGFLDRLCCKIDMSYANFLAESIKNILKAHINSLLKNKEETNSISKEI